MDKELETNKSLKHKYYVSIYLQLWSGPPRVATLLLNFYLCSSHVLLGLPRLLMPCTIRFFTILSGASSIFLFTCPNHSNLFSCNFVDISLSQFLIVSILVYPQIHLTILISATSIFIYKTFL